MSSIKEKQTELEIRGPERTFQYDRDTVIVYTGLHVHDARPFIRIGAGDKTPSGLLKHIENVVLPELDPVNVGLELYWMHSTLQHGGDVIRYVGSKDQVNRMYSYSGIRDMDDEKKPPVEIVPYTLMKASLRNAKEKSMINFFDTGNVNVNVDGMKVLDMRTYKKSSLNLDKEYDLISKSLSKRIRRCEEGTSFLFLNDTKTPGISMYWNFEGQGLLLNPPRDFHYRLFENAIDSKCFSMCISTSAYSPGFVEAIRRKNAIGSDIGLFCLDPERISDLKKIYSNAKLKVFEDSRTLPFAKDTAFYLSRTSSHSLFSIKLSSKTDRQAQILFPTGSLGKIRKTFDSMRGPFDLHIDKINSDELKKPEQAGLLFLHVPGDIKQKSYEKLNLSSCSYPLIGGREYKLHYAVHPAEMIENLLAGLELTEYQEHFKELILLSLGVDYEAVSIDRVLNEISKMPVPVDDIISLNNISEILRYISILPIFNNSYTQLQKKQFSILQKKFSLHKKTNADWLALKECDVEFDLLLLDGRISFLIVHKLKDEIVRLLLPPTIEELEKNPKLFIKEMRQKIRLIDRAHEAPGYRESVDFLEVIFEEKMRLIGERKRFVLLLEKLGIKLEREKKVTESSKLPEPLDKYLKLVMGYIKELIEEIRNKIS